MADIVNLNRFRKQKRREQAEQDAERNRLRHGRTKQEKRLEKLEREHAERELDAKKREPDSGPEDPSDVS